MKIPNKFDEIRPYEPEDLQEVYDKLFADPMFHGVMDMLYPGVSHDELEKELRKCKSGYEYEVRFVYPFLQRILAKCGKGFDMDSEVDFGKRYTFISNHRDIILDSALLAVLLVDAKCGTTVEIAIGDNLLVHPWVENIVRLSKAFIVKRSLTPRDFIISSKLLSDYMHFSINQKHENIWIAQREGRAKDSNDLTQPSILKMMCLGGEGSLKERLADLHLCPTAISYEYDPCDYLKAKEFQLKRDNAEYKKTRQDDALSMKTGMFGYKGHIHYHIAECIDEWLWQLPDNMPKTDFFNAVAAHIDTEIHRNYRIYPCNYIALDLLDGSQQYSDKYTQEEKDNFVGYINQQIAKIDLPNPDVPFLTERILTMYANPLRNHMK